MMEIGKSREKQNFRFRARELVVYGSRKFRCLLRSYEIDEQSFQKRSGSDRINDFITEKAIIGLKHKCLSGRKPSLSRQSYLTHS